MPGELLSCCAFLWDKTQRTPRSAFRHSREPSCSSEQIFYQSLARIRRTVKAGRINWGGTAIHGGLMVSSVPVVGQMASWTSSGLQIPQQPLLCPSSPKIPVTTSKDNSQSSHSNLVLLKILLSSVPASYHSNYYCSVFFFNLPSHLSSFWILPKVYSSTCCSHLLWIWFPECSPWVPASVIMLVWKNLF